MSQDDVQVIEEFLTASTRKKKSPIKKNEPKSAKPSTSTPVKSPRPSTSTSVKSHGESSQSITLSQDIWRQPNKFIASPNRSPSKKSSPALPKYSPYRKSSPQNKFKHKPINSYFKRTPEKSDSNSLNGLFESVKKSSEKQKDAVLFRNLLDQDSSDLLAVECNAALLTPKQTDTNNKSQSKIKSQSVKKESVLGDLNAISSKDSENASKREIDAVDDDDDIFKIKNTNKKIKKALFPDLSDNVQSVNTSPSSTHQRDAKITDCQNVDNFHNLDLDVSMELLKETSQNIRKSSREKTSKHHQHYDSFMIQSEGSNSPLHSRKPQKSETPLFPVELIPSRPSVNTPRKTEVPETSLFRVEPIPSQPSVNTRRKMEVPETSLFRVEPVPSRPSVNTRRKTKVPETSLFIVEPNPSQPSVNTRRKTEVPETSLFRVEPISSRPSVNTPRETEVSHSSPKFTNNVTKHPKSSFKPIKIELLLEPKSQINETITTPVKETDLVSESETSINSADETFSKEDPNLRTVSKVTETFATSIKNEYLETGSKVVGTLVSSIKVENLASNPEVVETLVTTPIKAEDPVPGPKVVENLVESIKDENPVSFFEGSDSQNYSYADIYSSCIEAVLEESLRFLNKHRDHGIIIKLDDLGKFINNGSMHQTRRKLYARLLISRQFRWYRVTDLKNYEGALNLSHADLVRALNCLEEEGLVTSNLDDVELPTLLNLLQVKDLKQLSKYFKINDNKTKPELIQQLLNFHKKQSVIPASFFSPSASNTKKDSVLVKRLKEMLGHCVKLCDGPRNSFIQCLIFVTYPHFYGDPSTRLSDHLNRLSQVQKNEISFPPYTVSKTVVFRDARQFTMYQEALEIYEIIFSAVESKDWQLLAKHTPDVFQRMKEILEDEEISEYVKDLPQFLRRFTAGHIYAKALFKSVTVNKRNSDKNVVISVLNLLLDQEIYLIHRRGSFYEELASTVQIYLKDNSRAMKIVIAGLKDGCTDEVMKVTLSMRGELLMNRKTDAVSDALKSDVQKLLVNLSEPTCVIIQARCLQGRAGYKQVYISETQDGLEFSSVEEMAKSHYRKLGFTQILHDEGGTLRSLIYAAFWDLIYIQPPNSTEHSVFHSPFQSHPLDWASSNFYSSRWDLFSLRCIELKKKGGKEKLMRILTKVCEEFENVESVVNWNYLSKSRLNLLKDFISALTTKVFVKISWHLLKNVAAYGKAFPDLTMWNPSTKRCMFAEVKSPNDRLSPGQKLWLNNLSKFGANAEVCIIRTLGSKKRKLEDRQQAAVEDQDLFSVP